MCRLPSAGTSALRHTTWDAAPCTCPIEGLIEDDLHVDNTARIVRTRNLIRAGRARRRHADRRAPGGDGRRARAGALARAHRADGSGVSNVARGDAGGGYTPMDGRSYGLALLSAGSALTALELVLAGETQTAHAMLRRSGHHASRDSGYGFCIFNNCAIAATAAREQFGLDRVAIVDIDAHHGNGTEAIFLAEPGVLTISIHQDRSFPVETGLGRDRRRRRGRGPQRQRQPAGGHRRPRLPLRGRPHRRSGAASLRAATRPRRVRRRREPLRSARPTRRHGHRLRRRSPERLLAVADDVCAGGSSRCRKAATATSTRPSAGSPSSRRLPRLPRHEDPYEAFIAGQACCREFPSWQRKPIDEQADFLRRWWPVAQPSTVGAGVGSSESCSIEWMWAAVAAAAASRVAGADRSQDRLVLVRSSDARGRAHGGTWCRSGAARCAGRREASPCGCCRKPGLDVGEVRQAVEQRRPCRPPRAPPGTRRRGRRGRRAPRGGRRLGEIPCDAGTRAADAARGSHGCPPARARARGLLGTARSRRARRAGGGSAPRERASWIRRAPSAMRASTSCSPGWSAPATISSRRRS